MAALSKALLFGGVVVGNGLALSHTMLFGREEEVAECTERRAGEPSDDRRVRGEQSLHVSLEENPEDLAPNGLPSGLSPLLVAASALDASSSAMSLPPPQMTALSPLQDCPVASLLRRECLEPTKETSDCRLWRCCWVLRNDARSNVLFPRSSEFCGTIRGLSLFAGTLVPLEVGAEFTTLCVDGVTGVVTRNSW